MRASVLLGIMIVGMAAVGCQESSTAKTEESGPDRTTLQGSTPHPVSLLLTCDDGRSYETSSQVPGVGRARFSLSLPRDLACRLWISDPRRGMRPVTFSDYRGNLSTLVYLRGSQIDLGAIRFSGNGADDRPVVTVDNNDLQLMASGVEAEFKTVAKAKGGKLLLGSRESDRALRAF
ncbi:hypothetical protein [Nitratifractor salsuginis]|uniref:Lipoprotein n=1 Tax=Nitratifractor salsuginis (strain DSM 16511 / JCM 12458 / E9I37-1) TaxID=749222 RepID=E6WZR1_NITSE|nr:hypothetical protein [Nitratifractor salsuginis]ADV46702.1 hypothetical protein Nitsa_1453 [Nitratifractor salsuginis DSM 16511]